MAFDLESSKVVEELDDDGGEEVNTGFDLASSKVVDSGSNNVYVTSRNKVIELPPDLNETESEYMMSTQIDKVDKSRFFGMSDLGSNFTKGLGNFFASLPQVVGSSYKEAGELLQANENKGWTSAIYAPHTWETAKHLIAKHTPLDDTLLKAGKLISSRNKAFVEKLGFKADSGLGNKVAFDVGQGVGSVFSSIALAMISKSPALVAGVFGLIQKSQIYEEFRNAGRDPKVSSRASNLAGGMEALVEGVGVSVFLKASKSNKLITRIGIRASEEMLQGGSQQLSEELITRLHGVREADFTEALKNIAYSASLEGLIGGGVGSIVSISESLGVKDQLIKAGVEEGDVDLVINEASSLVDKGGVRDIAKDMLNNELSPLSDVDNEVEVDLGQSEGEEVDYGEIEDQDITPPLDNSFREEEGVPDVKGADVYEENRKLNLGKRPKETSSVKANWLVRAITPVSSRLGDINNSLKTDMRMFEFKVKTSVKDHISKIKPYLEAYSKLSEEDKLDLDYAQKNGDIAKINEVLKRNGMSDEMSKVREVLDNLADKAKQVGLKINYLKNYHPRRIGDVLGFLKHLDKGDGWDIFAGVPLDKLKTKDLNGLIRQKVFGHKGQGVGATKSRKIETIPPELAGYYENGVKTLVSYIERMNEVIEARSFFGHKLDLPSIDVEEDVFLQDFQVDEMIGNYTLTLLAEGNLKPSQEADLVSILESRFASKGISSKAVQGYKTLGYISTLGSSVSSSITQIGDIAYGLYLSGAYNIGRSIKDHVSGKSRVSIEDIGISDIAQEFEEIGSDSVLSKVLEKSLGLTGFRYMDTLGKSTLINGAFYRLQHEVLSGNEALDQRLEETFGDEADGVKEDLKAGRATDNVRFLLFYELSEVQPISLSEMPEGYLKSGNLRVVYALKTFTIKQLDVYVNEIYKVIKTDPAKGLGNMLRLLGYLMLLNATGSIIKSILFRRKVKWDDLLVDNIIRLTGFSKYTIMRAEREGFGTSVLSEYLVPISKPVDALSKDLFDLAKGKVTDIGDLESHYSLPVVGGWYYWWMGKGRKKTLALAKKVKRKKLREKRGRNRKKVKRKETHLP